MDRLRRNLKRLLGSPRTILHPDWEILRPIGPATGPHVVLDIGAYRGWFFHCWKDWCPAAEIHAFEPRGEACQEAIALYGGDLSIRMNCMAVGESQGTAELGVLGESPASSSMLAHVPQAWEEIGVTTGDVTSRRVPVTTVDDYCRENAIESIYVMKIDVQGFELAVLRGAERTLPSVDHILVESAMRPLYSGAPHFGTVFDWLASREFHLMGMRAWHGGNNVLVETDMLFRRNELAPPIDVRGQRVYTEFAVRRPTHPMPRPAGAAGRRGAGNTLRE